MRCVFFLLTEFTRALPAAHALLSAALTAPPAHALLSAALILCSGRSLPVFPAALIRCFLPFSRSEHHVAGWVLRRQCLLGAAQRQVIFESMKY